RIDWSSRSLGSCTSKRVTLGRRSSISFGSEGHLGRAILSGRSIGSHGRRRATFPESRQCLKHLLNIQLDGSIGGIVAISAADAPWRAAELRRKDECTD